MPEDESPRAATARLLGGFRVTQLLRVAAELGLADLLAAGPQSIGELARRVGAQPDALHRVMRTLASHGVFVETEPRTFGPTPMSDSLRLDAPESLHAIAISYGQPWWWTSFGRLVDAVRTGRVAFELEYGEPLFEWLAHEPQAAAIFNANMSAMTQAEAKEIAGAYPFDDFGVFMDLGGGNGTLASALLARWPHLKGIVLDQLRAIEAARGRGLQSERCTLIEGDFFSDIPGGADLYVLKDILHDWTDEQCVEILRRCRAAMMPAARLLVVERLMPPGNEPATVKHVDITMLVMTGGRERTLEEYSTLLQRASFGLARAIPLRTEGALLEAAPT